MRGAHVVQPFALTEDGRRVNLKTIPLPGCRNVVIDVGDGSMAHGTQPQSKRYNWAGTWVAIRDFTLHKAGEGRAFIVGATRESVEGLTLREEDFAFYRPSSRRVHANDVWFRATTAVEDGFIISKTVSSADLERDPKSGCARVIREGTRV